MSFLMSEEEPVETPEEEQSETLEIVTCEDAKDAILKLIDERKKLEEKLLEGFDKKAFKDKKRLDRTIRHLFEDYAVCNIEEELPAESDSSSPNPDSSP